MQHRYLSTGTFQGVGSQGSCSAHTMFKMSVTQTFMLRLNFTFRWLDS